MLEIHMTNLEPVEDQVVEMLRWLQQGVCHLVWALILEEVLDSQLFSVVFMDTNQRRIDLQEEVVLVQENWDLVNLSI